MPIYEYRCESCGHELEALQRVSDDALTDCPECETPELKKLMSAAGFRLKGGGWYETDFKTGSKRNLVEKADGKGSSDKSSTKESKSDKSTSKSSTNSSKSDSNNNNRASSAA